MKRVVFLCLVGLFVISCGAPSPPPMPTVKTLEGKANIRSCIALHNQCVLPCHGLERPRSESCLKRCDSNLEVCYSIAE
jgi:hypothetical protein